MQKYKLKPSAPPLLSEIYNNLETAPRIPKTTNKHRTECERKFRLAEFHRLAKKLPIDDQLRVKELVPEFTPVAPAAIDENRDLTEPPLAEVNNGLELGLRVKGYFVKTSRSILDCAVTIHKAYEKYYVPLCSRGRPSDYVDERLVDLSEQWSDFLTASGFQMPRHQKMLRNYWRIGAKYHRLKDNTGNLPNSVDALSELCAEDLTGAEFDIVLAELTRTTTAEEVRSFIRMVRTVPDDLGDMDVIPEDVKALQTEQDLIDVDNELNRQDKAQEPTLLHAKISNFQRDEEKPARQFTFPSIAVTEGNTVEIAIAILMGQMLGMLQLTDTEIELAYGKRFLDVYTWMKDTQWWSTHCVYGLKRLREHSHLVVKAKGLEHETKQIEKVREVA